MPGESSLMTDDDIFAAGNQPGFGDDHTIWRVFVDRSRYLRQEVVVVDVGNFANNEVLRYSARLAREEFASLWEIVERIGFERLERRYRPSTFCMTDCESYWAGVRWAGRRKEVWVYDLRRMVELEQDPVA